MQESIPANILNYYYIPSCMSQEICDTILKDFFDEEEIVPSLIGKTNIRNTKIRDSLQRWLPTDSWIAGMLSHFIHCANNDYFEFNLTGWHESIQFTVYKSPKSHYSWHTDIMPEPRYINDKKTIRKLSIVMCLSSANNYGGGEFQLFYPTKNLKTFKLDVGDVLIFPSILSHRVLPVTWGTRVSLVGWYGGPPFR